MATPRSFLLPLAAFSLACAALLFAALRALQLPITGHYLVAVLYFPATTGLLHGWHERGSATDPRGFVRQFMTGLVLKMFLSIAVLVISMLFAPAGVRVPFALSFAAFYLAFLVFSTGRLLRLSRPAPRA